MYKHRQFAGLGFLSCFVFISFHDILDGVSQDPMSFFPFHGIQREKAA